MLHFGSLSIQPTFWRSFWFIVNLCLSELSYLKFLLFLLYKPIKQLFQFQRQQSASENLGAKVET